jgi:hypothetical protein
MHGREVRAHPQDLTAGLDIGGVFKSIDWNCDAPASLEGKAG